MYRKRRCIERIKEWIRDMITDTSRNIQDLYNSRILLRYNVIELQHQITSLRESLEQININLPGYRQRIRDAIQGMYRIIYGGGLTRMDTLLELLELSREDYAEIQSHSPWLYPLARIIQVSVETLAGSGTGGTGASPRIQFQSIETISKNNLETYYGVLLKIPKHHYSFGSPNKDIRGHSLDASQPPQPRIYVIRLMLHRDPLGCIRKHFQKKLHLVMLRNQDFQISSSILQQCLEFIHPKMILCLDTLQLNRYCSVIWKIREKLTNIPFHKFIKEFGTSSTDKQIQYLIALLLKEPGQSHSYSYLITTLYDIIANESFAYKRDVHDLLDLLPYKVLKEVRDVRNRTTFPKYNVGDDDIPEENRIHLMNISQDIKKLAIQRLQESKSRQGEGSSKASSWIQSFLKIPFGIYRKEPILTERTHVFQNISKLLQKSIISKETFLEFIDSKSELLRHPKGLSISPSVILSLVSDDTENGIYHSPPTKHAKPKMKDLLQVIKELHIHPSPIVNTGRKTTQQLLEYICTEIQNIDAEAVETSFRHIGIELPQEVSRCIQAWNLWKLHQCHLRNYLDTTREILDSVVYRQTHVKHQVLRIIGQWLTGQETGYCLGFEGPPGIGKTTLAREGLANVLKDDSGQPRPFKMIALGGTSNGSTLIGHNYTYLGSQFGEIVRILIASECMNPIIYIDELDKVSNTEYGAEIIGILTHLTDPAQNQEFIDRYFQGIPLDVSRVLFIFSYNDPSKIDPILLDRIHRIQFQPLTPNEKEGIAYRHIIPSIQRDIGFAKGEITITPATIQHCIQHYNREAGVRKLKEILYDAFREMNLQSIGWISSEGGEGEGECESSGYSLTSREITTSFIDSVVMKYTPRNHLPKCSIIPSYSRVYGLFATSLGYGGVLPIQICEDATAIGTGKSSGNGNGNLTIRHTGSLGDVMKESIQIAHSVALRHAHNHSRIPLHIHFPEGATPKDGPSAGLSITLLIWAFLTKTFIPATIAMTGEIDLEGNILPIGGVSSKLLGAYFQGIQTIILPEENRRDYNLFQEQNQSLPIKVIFVKTFRDLPFFSSSNGRWRVQKQNTHESLSISSQVSSGRPRSYSL
jgi:hypothetical protein